MSTNEKKRRLKRIALKEISAVRTPAQEGAKITLMKSADGEEIDLLAKGVYLLTSVDGHTHLLTGSDSKGELNNGYTSRTEMRMKESKYYDGYHSHPWVRMPSGDITVGMALGHTHEIDVMGKGVKDMSSETQTGTADPKADKITADLVKNLEAKLERLSIAADLTDDQRTFYKSLDETAQEAFRKAKPEERDLQVQDAAKKAAEADEIYKSADGTVYKRSEHGVAAMKLAKKVDALDKRTTRAEAMAKAAQQETELRKEIAADFAHLPGTDDHKLTLLKAIKGIEDEAARKAAMEVLKSNAKAITEFTKTTGTTSAPEALDKASPAGKMEIMEEEWAEKNNKTIHEAADHLAKSSTKYQALYQQAYA